MDKTIMEESIRKLESIVYTLNLVEVKGRNNLDRLLGSLLAIEKVKDTLAALSQQPDAANE